MINGKFESYSFIATSIQIPNIKGIKWTDLISSLGLRQVSGIHDFGVQESASLYHSYSKYLA